MLGCTWADDKVGMFTSKCNPQVVAHRLWLPGKPVELQLCKVHFVASPCGQDEHVPATTTLIRIPTGKIVKQNLVR